jgi:hypothetical protein
MKSIPLYTPGGGKDENNCVYLKIIKVLIFLHLTMQKNSGFIAANDV